MADESCVLGCISTIFDVGPGYTCIACVKLAFCCVVLGCAADNGESVTAEFDVCVVA